jgi:hypothetical protein
MSAAAILFVRVFLDFFSADFSPFEESEILSGLTSC